jgi:hypothetical protein
MRTVVVIQPDTGNEVGRGMLLESGRATVSGFPEPLREAYEREGILDMAGVAGKRGATVPLSRGSAFLDVLFADWQRPQTGVAQEGQQ